MLAGKSGLSSCLQNYVNVRYRTNGNIQNITNNEFALCHDIIFIVFVNRYGSG